MRCQDSRGKFLIFALACFFLHVAPLSNFELTWAQACREGLPPF